MADMHLLGDIRGGEVHADPALLGRWRTRALFVDGLEARGRKGLGDSKVHEARRSHGDIAADVPRSRGEGIDDHLAYIGRAFAGAGQNIPLLEGLEQLHGAVTLVVAKLCVGLPPNAMLPVHRRLFQLRKGGLDCSHEGISEELEEAAAELDIRGHCRHRRSSCRRPRCGRLVHDCLQGAQEALAPWVGIQSRHSGHACESHGKDGPRGLPRAGFKELLQGTKGCGEALKGLGSAWWQRGLSSALGSSTSSRAEHGVLVRDGVLIKVDEEVLFGSSVVEDGKDYGFRGDGGLQRQECRLQLQLLQLEALLIAQLGCLGWSKGPRSGGHTQVPANRICTEDDLLSRELEQGKAETRGCVGEQGRVPGRGHAQRHPKGLGTREALGHCSRWGVGRARQLQPRARGRHSGRPSTGSWGLATAGGRFTRCRSLLLLVGCFLGGLCLLLQLALARPVALATTRGSGHFRGLLRFALLLLPSLHHCVIVLSSGSLVLVLEVR
mmetsp:Transcript_29488/g.85975  ORF Transcript_29488/g.85975 Transcript_29488/m.85975 type:complete len:496 (+) Transcript_29488:1576-3063(+)